jgi:dihydroneopterin aldolase
VGLTVKPPGVPLNSQSMDNAANDVVFVDSLHVSANIGPDCWDRNQIQPIDISVYLLLKESYLDRVGASDDLLDSIDYSTLSKQVSNYIKDKSESDKPSFSGPDELIRAVSERAFDLAGEAAAAVRVTMGAPKLILLASGFSVDIITSSTVIASKRVLIKDLVLPVIIGVNPAERKAKQQVKVNLIFHENTTSSTVVNYQEVVAQLCEASFTSLF